MIPLQPGRESAVYPAVAFLGVTAGGRAGHDEKARGIMSGTYARTSTGAWRNWAGNVTARPVRTVSPASVEELAEVIRTAAASHLSAVPLKTPRVGGTSA